VTETTPSIHPTMSPPTSRGRSHTTLSSISSSSPAAMTAADLATA
jgi:hypothetical protein